MVWVPVAGLFLRLVKELEVFVVVCGSGDGKCRIVNVTGFSWIAKSMWARLFVADVVSFVVGVDENVAFVFCVKKMKEFRTIFWNKRGLGATGGCFEVWEIGDLEVAGEFCFL